MGWCSSPSLSLPRSGSAVKARPLRGGRTAGLDDRSRSRREAGRRNKGPSAQSRGNPTQGLPLNAPPHSSPTRLPPGGWPVVKAGEATAKRLGLYCRTPSRNNDNRRRDSPTTHRLFSTATRPTTTARSRDEHTDRTPEQIFFSPLSPPEAWKTPEPCEAGIGAFAVLNLGS